METILIKSTKMPSFPKNRWLGVFQDDLTKVNWQRGRKDNLEPEQHQALRELKEAPNLVIKKSDKGVMWCYSQQNTMKTR